jgi:hypothetical protein
MSKGSNHVNNLQISKKKLVLALKFVLSLLKSEIFNVNLDMNESNTLPYFGILMLRFKPLCGKLSNTRELLVLGYKGFNTTAVRYFNIISLFTPRPYMWHFSFRLQIN